jgi:hypothetical protein
VRAASLLLVGLAILLAPGSRPAAAQEPTLSAREGLAHLIRRAEAEDRLEDAVETTRYYRTADAARLYRVQGRLEDGLELRVETWSLAGNEAGLRADMTWRYGADGGLRAVRVRFALVDGALALSGEVRGDRLPLLVTTDEPHHQAEETQEVPWTDEHLPLTVALFLLPRLLGDSVEAPPPLLRARVVDGMDMLSHTPEALVSLAVDPTRVAVAQRTRASLDGEGTYEASLGRQRIEEIELEAARAMLEQFEQDWGE